MQIVIASVHFEQHDISPSNLANRGPAHSQPMGFIQDNVTRYGRAPKFRTVSILWDAPLGECLSARDHNDSAWFII